MSSGATAALKDTASQALKDAYGSFRHLLHRKFEGKEAEVILERYETKPEIWYSPLRDELARIGADRDERILQAAETLMALVDPDGSGTGKYQIHIVGSVQGTVIGDHANVTQSFGSGLTRPQP